MNLLLIFPSRREPLGFPAPYIPAVPGVRAAEPEGVFNKSEYLGGKEYVKMVSLRNTRIQPHRINRNALDLARLRTLLKYFFSGLQSSRISRHDELSHAVRRITKKLLGIL